METGQERRVSRDGRVVAFDVFGPAEAPAVVYLHGAGDSRLAHPRNVEALAIWAGVRLVAVDRAGYGGSARHEKPSFSATVEDVIAVVDEVGIEGFSAMGWSAGSPFALACAAAHPDRVRSCVLYGPVLPMATPGWADGLDPSVKSVADAARDRPDELRAVLAEMTGDPSGFVRAVILSEVGGEDLLADPDIAAQVDANAKAALCNGVDAMVEDFVLSYAPWDFDLDLVRCPVLIRTGSNDALTPTHWGRSLAMRLEKGRFEEVPCANHHSLLRNADFGALLRSAVTAPAEHTAIRGAL